MMNCCVKTQLLSPKDWNLEISGVKWGEGIWHKFMEAKQEILHQERGFNWATSGLFEKCLEHTALFHWEVWSGSPSSLTGTRCHCTTMKVQLKKPLTSNVKKHLLKKTICCHGKGWLFLHKLIPNQSSSHQSLSLREKELEQRSMLLMTSSFIQSIHPKKLCDLCTRWLCGSLNIGTGFIQANETYLHRQLKAYYRDLEIELMMETLRADKKKVPTPTREEMINMTVKAAKKIDVNLAEVFR